MNEEGKYTMYFCKNGEWVKVTVDDYFPCGGHRGGPLFSRSHGDELWVLLLEKGYAKLHGSYMLLRSGFPEDGFLDLTGCPTISIIFNDEVGKQMIKNGTLWSKLLKYDQ